MTIIYKHNPFKLINGTLFYCFEYYMFLKDHVDIEFKILNISIKDLNKVKDIFLEKYNIQESDLLNISLARRVDVFNMSGPFLVFDIITLKTIMHTTREKIFAYSNDTHNILKNNITFYGYYDYQVYDIKELLQFNFNVYKDVIYNPNGIVYSTAGNLTNKVTKKHSTHTKDMFSNMSRLDYYHNALDKNNRLIIEARYYNIPINYIDSIGTVDSALLRFNDTIDSIEDYRLTTDSQLIKDILDYTTTKT